MNRNIDIDEISDGKRYRSNDLVKVGCNDCHGCSACCHGMGESIVLDPYDVCKLSEALNKNFDTLLSEEIIALHVYDGLLLPHLKMDGQKDCCQLLNEDGRCSIHPFRPGFCRLFPLGRIYEECDFTYFLQIHECPHQGKSKVKIKKWLGIDNISAYERFVLHWHDYCDIMRNRINAEPDMNDKTKLSVGFLKMFYKTPLEIGDTGSVTEQIEKRIRDSLSETNLPKED